jgi:hypothetical protein
MIDWAGIVTVFAFMLALMVSASISGWIFAKWQNDETQRDIARGFADIKEKLKGHR